MQRFKKEYRKVIDGNTPIPLGSVWRRISCDGKFVYGANGTLTQAARWRKQAVVEIGRIGKALHIETAHFYRCTAYDLLKASRRGGCVLP